MFERSGFKLFSFGGVDVSISLWFPLILLFITFQMTNGWLAAIAIALSILVHEYGHAIPSKFWSLNPSILLHGFGGLCFHDEAPTDWKDIAIVIAGPAIEIVLGLIAFACLPFVPAETLAYTFVYYFAWFSVVWGLANLLAPIYPLDGGKLFLLVLRRFMSEKSAREWTLYISIGLAAILTIAAFATFNLFFGILGFFILMENWNAMQGGYALINRKAKARASDFVKSTIKEAEAAFQDEDWREAARLCHLLRSGKEDIPQKQMNRVWEILSLSTVEMGEFEEAVGWLKRAPETAAIKSAKAKVEQAMAN